MQREPFRHKAVTVVFVGLFAGLTILIASSAAAEQPSDHTVSSSEGVVAADHPLASEVGAGLLAKGGSAVDAAVGTLLTLGVVNPFASGLGGGGFCLVRPVDGDVDVIDFRERAPGRADHDMYLRDGKAKMELAMRGGLAVGVPGEPRGLAALHQKFGKLEWSAVVKPARLLAQNGFEVGELLPKRLKASEEKLSASPALTAAFRKSKSGKKGGKGDRWVAAGETLARPDLSKALLLLEQQGAKPFYEGPIALAIVRAVNDADGIFEAGDLSSYRATWREPLRGLYRGHEIFTMPPPSSGGTTILEALNILERYDLPTLGHNPESIHRIVEALKHAFADRATWLGDADFVSVPSGRLTAKKYAADKEIKPGTTQPAQAYGGSAQLPKDAGTSHISVIDKAGNMVACTSTVNTTFGAVVYVPEFGIVLNNQMGDFTAQPGVANNYGLMGTEQNAVAPHKRPLSSMSPTLVLKDGTPFMAVGASGGPTIITGTLLTLIRVIDWGWTPLEAVAGPRIHHQWMPDVLFVESLPESWQNVLKRRGHAVQTRDAYNSVQMVLRSSDGKLIGVSDPRKMGRPAAVPGTK